MHAYDLAWAGTCLIAWQYDLTLDKIKLSSFFLRCGRQGLPRWQNLCNRQFEIGLLVEKCSARSRAAGNAGGGGRAAAASIRWLIAPIHPPHSMNPPHPAHRRPHPLTHSRKDSIKFAHRESNPSTHNNAHVKWPIWCTYTFCFPRRNLPLPIIRKSTTAINKLYYVGIPCYTFLTL